MLEAIRRRRDDRGSALIIVVLTMGVCVSLSLIGVATAINTNKQSGKDRQRLLAINAAEAGVDQAISSIANGGANPPCSVASANVRSGPDTAAYSTIVTYYNAAGGVMPCPVGSAAPAQALIQATATTNSLVGGTVGARRVMEALVTLTPATGPSLDKAIFSDSNLGFTNATTVKGNLGTDGNIYSNSDIKCTNNTNVAGSVFSQGSFTGSNSCGFGGDMWVQNNITSTGPSFTIGGAAKTNLGNISVSKGTVSGNLYAGGTISAASSGCPSSKCFPNNSQGQPPRQDFPQLSSDSAPWAAQGFTVVTATCANAISAMKTYGASSTPTLLKVTCANNTPVDLSKQSFTVSSNFAVFAPGGFKTSNNTSFATGNASGVNLYLIQPYDSVSTHPCTANGFTVSNLLTMGSGIASFVYSPCNISFTNHGIYTGQVYAGGTFTTSNNFDMQFKPVPVYGITNGPPASYSPSIVYKRETS